jgi:hypothetical protein
MAASDRNRPALSAQTKENHNMTMENGKLIADNAQYRFVQSVDKKSLLFEWKHVAGLSTQDFRNGIDAFAQQCKEHKPNYALIDASLLDQSSPAVSWLRAQQLAGEREDYRTWWTREIVPAYHVAGITCLAVGTGDPNAPGVLLDTPGVHFKIGYFPDISTALGWKPN